MKELFKKYWPIIKFLLLFLGTYALLSSLYFFYLSWSIDGSYYPDVVTHIVAKQTESVLNTLGYTASLQSDPNLPTLRVLLFDSYVGNINEGCNALSIMILFVAFIVAFAQKIKKTILFILVGLALIYATNIVRIVILSIALYKYPESTNFLHDIVFPGIIYGMVFILWLFWVRNISKNTNE